MNLLIDNDDNYDNRIELIANLKVLKEKLSNININDFTENNPADVNNVNLNTLNNRFDGCNSFITKMKEFKEIQNNPSIITFINNFQNQMKGTKGDLGVENLLNAMTCDKEIQTEKLEEEYDKIAEKFEKEKRVLNKQIDDHEVDMMNLKREIIELKEKNKAFNDQIPFNEKKIREKNTILESNLRDLRKKLEESQIQRIMCENQNNALVKSMREKNACIGNLEKEIAELKANSYNRSNQPVAGNIYRVITGGQQSNAKK